MSQPIKIIVTAETAQAALQLQQFVAQAGTGLKSLTAATAATGKAAEESGLRIAGMSYYARGAIDSIRYAAAGGGARAGFYALDETIRGLLQSGMTLGTLVPIIGGVVAAVGAGVAVWETWNAAEKEAADRSKELVENYKELPGILKQLAEFQKAGFLSPAAYSKYSDQLAHPEKYFVDDKGQITSQATRQEYHEAQAVGGGPLSPFGGGQVIPAGLQTIANKVATFADVKKSATDFMTAGGTLPEERAASLNAVQDTVKQINEESLQGAEKEIAKTRDDAQKMRDKLLLEIQTAAANLGQNQPATSWKDWLLGVNPPPSGVVNVLTPEKMASAQTAYKKIDTDEQAKIAAIQQKAQDEAAKKQVESANKIREQGLKDFADANSQLDRSITLEAQQGGKQREDLWQEEYKQRIQVATEALYSGQIDEKEYTKAVEDAQVEMSKGQKRYNEELARTNQLNQEIARGEIEARIKGIESNPLLTQGQKDSQTSPLYGDLYAANTSRISQLRGQAAAAAGAGNIQAQLEAEKQLVQLKEQQAELENKIAEAAAPQSAAIAFGETFARMKSAAEINFVTLAATFNNVFNNAISSVSNGITALIMGTKSWGQTLLQIGTSIATNIISAIVEMGVRWIATQVLMATVGKEITTAATAALIPIAASQALIWWTPAVLSTIASAGTTALDAPALVTAATLAGFSEGGRPEPGQPAIIGEKGWELWVPDRPGTVFSNEQSLAMIDRGRSLPDQGGRAVPAQPLPPKVITVFDRQGLMDELKKPDYGHITVQHVIENKTKIGIPT